MDIHSLVSNLWYVILVVLFFGGSIFVHELGHFLAARARGVHVERFSIGFGPAIWKHRAKDGVEYRLSWLPLGGYVALPQLADMSAIEGSAGEDVKRLPPPSYSTKVIVFVAGAFFNILFALALGGILWLTGYPEPGDTAGNLIGYVSPTVTQADGKVVPSPAAAAGIRVGDRLISIDGKPVTDWQDIVALISLGSGRTDDGRRNATFGILRDGKRLDLEVYPLLVGSEKDRKVGIGPGSQLVLATIKPGSYAEQAGFRPGDVIQSIGTTRIYRVDTAQEALEATPPPTAAVVLREGKEVNLTLPKPEIRFDAGQFGIELASDVKLVHRNPFAQVRDHAILMYRTIASWINPHSDVTLSKFSGPVGIVRIFHNAAEAGLQHIIWFTILINVNLALFNLLPIPVLDGGHILFATIAKIRGRALPAEFIATTQSIFMLLLFSMILYVTFFDARRIYRERQLEPLAAPAQPAAAPAR